MEYGTCAMLQLELGIEYCMVKWNKVQNMVHVQCYS